MAVAICYLFKDDFQSLLLTLESLFPYFCFVSCKTSQDEYYLHELNSKFQNNRHAKQSKLEALFFVISYITR